jgi:DNA mismatch repair ATPase MutL
MKETGIKVNYRVEDWKKFKVKLFDIYEHRIENAMEISGAVNNSYLTLEEHLLIYFIEKHSIRQRIEIERLVLEFLISLRSHAEYGWERASIFA